VNATLIERILDELPQTQCARCGHDGCRPYAVAIAEGAPINRCPPGGEATIRALAGLLGRDPLPLDPEVGAPPLPVTAFIREAECIGCFKCVQACPVDAIVGAPRLMHTVIASECTGCELCVPPCPVDCIELRPLAPGAPPPWSAIRARARAVAREQRRGRERQQAQEQRDARRRVAAGRAARATRVKSTLERVQAARRARARPASPRDDERD
jgi:electron transport complex protein RnfB